MNNQQAFVRFMELLENRQISYDQGRDIREHVLSLTAGKVGFGYVSAGLNKSFGANLKNLFAQPLPVDDPTFAGAGAFFALGTIYKDKDKSHHGAVRLFNSASDEKDIILFEAGFLASTHSWAHSFEEHNPSYACLGYVYDDMAHYFMADYPNRIIEKLNGAETPTDAESKRAEALIARIVKQRISKYNAQPMTAPTMTEGYSRRVLVVDQAYADASTLFGKVTDEDFERMLLAALTENPESEILVKTHPDTTWAKNDRTGFYTHLQSQGRVRILRDPVNPFALFDLVDTVYVGTSQMGLEALFAGKKVVTFGAPFYGGWGLTDDRQTIPHRHRKRSLVELFHYFYVWYTIYNVPGKQGPAEIEDVLSYIEKNRPYPLPPSEKELAMPPKVSVIIPVHGVERYIEECITSVQRQTLREIEIIPINDCSPDNSQQIIDRLAAEDLRIKPIILKENIGQGFARNKGIDAARGDFLWFIDGDDWMPNPEFLEQALAMALANGSDMVRGRKLFKQLEDADGSILKTVPEKTEAIFDDRIENTTFEEQPTSLVSWNFWLWLYRRNFLNENSIRFDLTRMEERPFVIRALLASTRIGFLNEDAVRYRVRPTSTMRRARTKSDNDNMRRNIELVADAFVQVGASNPDSPYKKHLNIALSQLINAILWGVTYRSIRELEDQAGVDELLDSLRALLLSSGFSPDDICDPHGLHLRDVVMQAHGYRLAVAAILARRYEILQIAIDQGDIPQKTLYEAFFVEPENDQDAALQAALNYYARNERVIPTRVTPGPLSGPKPRIVIHIGATKTASTFIQHMLEKNRPTLLREGVWYPEVGLFWQPTRPHKQAGHSEFTESMVRGDLGLKDYIDRGLELMEGRVHTIVLSSEAYFLNDNAPKLAEYFVGYPVEMIVYLRRQDEWANSQYCEFVSGGAVGRVDISVAAWLDQPKVRERLDYAAMLAKWVGYVGQENVHVRVYDRAQFEGGDLITDFARTAGLPQLAALPRPNEQQQNEARLSSGHVELIRLFNQRPFADSDSYFNFIEEVGAGISAWRQSAGLPIAKPFVMSSVMADALMDAFAEANIEIARTYLSREDGVLFGPRGKIPEAGPVYPEEISLVESIYRKYSPSETVTKSAEAPVGKPQAGIPNPRHKLNERDRVLATADALIRQLEAERDFLRERNAKGRSRLRRLAEKFYTRGACLVRMRRRS